MSELANLMSQDDPIGMSEPSVVVTIEVNGTTTTAQVPTRASAWPTSCATAWASPARTSGASRECAECAPSCSTARR